MKSLIAIIISVLLSNLAIGAEKVSDPELEFSIEAPIGSQVNKQGDYRGKSLSLAFESANNERIVVQAFRANNGGFRETKEEVFNKIIEGVSQSFGQKPSLPLRKLAYKDKQLFAATHIGVQGMVIETICYFEDRGSWRKLITLHISSYEDTPLSDTEIIDKLSLINFVPSFFEGENQ